MTPPVKITSFNRVQSYDVLTDKLLFVMAETRCWRFRYRELRKSRTNTGQKEDLFGKEIFAGFPRTPAENLTKERKQFAVSYYIPLCYHIVPHCIDDSRRDCYDVENSALEKRINSR